MDSLDAVAVSMLPVPRARVAAAFKDVHERARRLGVVVASGPPLLDGLLQSCGVPFPQIRESVSLAFDRATAAMQAAGEAVPIALDDIRYPVLLSCVPDPPPVIWVRGQVDVLSRPIVA